MGSSSALQAVNPEVWKPVHTNLHRNVHSTFTHKSLEVEPAYMCFCRASVHGILLSHEKERTRHTGNLDGWQALTLNKKASLKAYIPYLPNTLKIVSRMETTLEASREMGEGGSRAWK